MSSQSDTGICQRCGSGYVLTTTHYDLLQRRDARVITPVLCPTCFLTHGPMPKQRGMVKWYNPNKHYGFIVTQSNQEVFFHERQVLSSCRRLRTGQEVQFHLHYPIKGPEALNVELVET